MGRILLIVLIAVAIWLLVKSFSRRSSMEPPRPARSAAGEDMVECARCGVHLPKSETRVENGRLVCANNPNCRGRA